MSQGCTPKLINHKVPIKVRPPITNPIRAYNTDLNIKSPLFTYTKI